MTKPTGIILLEGGDACGKTTLANALKERYDALVLHSTVRKDIWRWHVGALRWAVRASRERLVVLDRHWLSEQVYGQVFRGGPAYDLGARCVERVLMANGALTVLCAPADSERQLARHVKLSETRKEHFSNIAQVVRRYADLRDGNLAQPGKTYLDQLIRFGDYVKREDVVVYDLDRQGRNLHAFAGYLAKRLSQLRAVHWLDVKALTGSVWSAKYLFLGERLSPRWPGGLREFDWSFFWNDGLSAATWLNRALHALYFDERLGLWLNAKEPDGVASRWGILRELRDRRPNLRVIALGQVALDAAAAAGFGAVRALPHPQHQRRFNAKRPEDYQVMLREAMK